MPFVLDGSVAAAWVFEDEGRPLADSVLIRLPHDGAVVPVIWSREVANAVVSAERRSRITTAQAFRFLDLLSSLRVTVADDDIAGDLSSIVAVARDDGPSTYDASYLDLARRLGLPLATLEIRLASAARQAGVGLLAEGTR